MKKIGLSPRRVIRLRSWQLLALLVMGTIPPAACATFTDGGAPPATSTPVPPTATGTPQPPTAMPTDTPTSPAPTPMQTPTSPALPTIVVPMMGTCVDFEGLTAGTTYNVGDSFIDSGVTITVVGYSYCPTATCNITFDGFAMIGSGLLAGGSGQEIHTNNAAMGFVVPWFTQVSRITLKFGEYGGTINMNINLPLTQIFDNFDTLTNIGGVPVTVVNGHGNDTGSLEIKGVINNMPWEQGNFILTIGGQELWLDDVCWYP